MTAPLNDGSRILYSSLIFTSCSVLHEIKADVKCMCSGIEESACKEGIRKEAPIVGYGTFVFHTQNTTYILATWIKRTNAYLQTCLRARSFCTFFLNDNMAV